MPSLKPNEFLIMDLSSAREQFEVASINLRTKASLGVDDKTMVLWRAYHDAKHHLLACERLAAEANGEQYAVEWLVEAEWPLMPENPMLITGPVAATLMFDGASAVLQVVFRHLNGVRVSCISDEVIGGHPLFGKGLSAYGLFKVINSAWLDELRRCDAVHPQHNEAHWKAAAHYLLCFKDRIAEVITAQKPTWYSFATREEAVRASVALCGIEAPLCPERPPPPRG